MTKQIRIENADLATFPVRVVYERKKADGTWEPDSEQNLSNPTAMFHAFVTSTRRIVVEEAQYGTPYGERSTADKITELELNEMANRFLAWDLPSEEFRPDGGITFTPGSSKVTGTNLFTHEQAKAMIRHLLG